MIGAGAANTGSFRMRVGGAEDEEELSLAKKEGRNKEVVLRVRDVLE